MRKWLPICLAVAGLACWAAPALQASHSDHGCFNCHLPHNAADPSEWGGVPLMSTNRLHDLEQYTLYSSVTFDALGATITQPDGASKLCLGCHDGSYSHVSAEHTFSEAELSLARSHPISVVYDSALAAKTSGLLRDPDVALSQLAGGGTIAADLLDANHKIQCPSCHDVHTSGIGFMIRPFQGLEVNTTEGDPDEDRLTNEEIMCRVCHNK